MTTIAESIVFLGNLAEFAGGYVSVVHAKAHGFETPDGFNDVSVFQLAMRYRKRVVEEPGEATAPDFVDDQGCHFEMSDGSWIVYKKGVAKVSTHRGASLDKLPVDADLDSDDWTYVIEYGKCIIVHTDGESVVKYELPRIVSQIINDFR